jgi:hypothetical protein
VKCVACQRVIADGSKFCPYCGNVQPDSPTAAPATSTPPSVRPPAGDPAAMPGSSFPTASAALPGTVVPPGGTAGPASQRATMSMIMGIASIVLSVMGCCCWGVPSLVGIGLGIGAFVMGRNELEDIAGGFAAAAGQSHASTAKTTGIIGIIAGGVCMIGGIILGLAFVSNGGGNY